MKKDNRQRLFEVMGRLDSNFKPRLNEGNFRGVNPKYTHFAVLKPNNMIINGWDYSGYDPEELRQYKMDYFFNDISDMQIDPKIVNILTTKTLQRRGINPFDFSYWNKDNSVFTNESADIEPEQPQEEIEFLPISTPAGSPDDKLFTDVVKQGIDSHLEGFTKSKFEIKNASNGNRRIFNFHKSEIPILLRRLEGIGTEEALQWKEDIQNYDANINEIIEELTTKQGLFEVMGRLDNNFKSNLNENNENNLSDVVAADIIKLIFNQQELQVFQQAMQTDASDFNADVELNPMANHESNALREEILKVLQSKGVQINKETIDLLKFEVWNFLI